MIDYTFERSPRTGDVIRGRVQGPAGDTPRSVVIVVHGFKGFKDWGFFPHTCDRLAAAGHTVVSFNFSRNGVGPGLQDFTELERFATNTLSIELDELRYVIDQLFDGDLIEGRPLKVGLLGHSRGGGQVILAAAEDPRIDALVSWAAVSDFDRWTAETRAEWRQEGRIHVLNGRTGQQMPLDLSLLDDFEANRARLDILGAAARLTVPWLIVHGTHDLTVRPREANALAAAQPDADLLIVEEAGHTFNAAHPFTAAPPQLDAALAATLAHFDRHLG